MVATASVPDLHEIRSAVFSHIGYDADNQEIHVKMHSGAQHAYGSCTRAEWHDFWNSPSRGAHFMRQIKGKHPERRIECA